MLALALLLGALHGVVMRGPTMPVCRVGVPCSEPAKNTTLEFTRDGRHWLTRTDANGRYRVRLPRGYYTVSTTQRIGAPPRPAHVHVVAGRDLRLDFELDTGIR